MVECCRAGQNGFVKVSINAQQLGPSVEFIELGSDPAFSSTFARRCALPVNKIVNYLVLRHLISAQGELPEGSFLCADLKWLFSDFKQDHFLCA